MRGYRTENPDLFTYQIFDDEKRYTYSSYSKDWSEDDYTMIEEGNLIPRFYKRIPILRIFLALGSFTLTGCGQICSKEPSLNLLLRELQAFVDFNDTNVCDMEFGDPGYKRAGVAAIAPYVRCDITIKTGLPPFQLRATAYHEIAHCLGVDHDYSPSYSIMSPSITGEYFLKENWPRLQQEFVTRYDNYF